MRVEPDRGSEPGEGHAASPRSIVLACVDFSPVTSAVLREAARLARATGALLGVLHARPDEAREPEEDGFGFSARASQDEDETEVHDVEDRLRVLASAVAEGAPFEAVVVHGEPADAVLSYARARPVELVVVGSHGRTLVFELLVGSVTQRILMNARVPVLVVPSREAHEEP